MVTEGVEPRFWPRPYPDDVTRYLPGALEGVLCSVASLSAHQVRQLADAFSAAARRVVSSMPLMPCWVNLRLAMNVAIGDSPSIE